MTPPETFALARDARSPDEPGWSVRVVPNKFPAFSVSRASAGTARRGLLETRPARGRQEVVVHSPRHVRSLADLSDDELDRIAETWRARAHAARREGSPYLHALVNEGPAAGASLAHSHSQLVWLPEEPPAVARERQEQAESDGCKLCRLLEEELDSGIRVVAEWDGVALLSAFAARQPYELLAAPLACEPDPFASQRLGDAVRLVAEGIRRLRTVEGPTPANAWLHAAGHWHLELVPRLAIVAGLELGADLSINTVPPEEAARLLREGALSR